MVTSFVVGLCWFGLVLSDSPPMDRAAAGHSNSVPILLLPPSEGKAGGGARRGRVCGWRPDAGSFGALAGSRTTVVEALAAVGGGDERLLGVRGDHLLRAQAANSSLIGAATLPAWQRYSGVVWDHLHPVDLPPATRRQIVVVSGLLGLVRADDPTPDHRLKMGASLPPLGRLARWWRPELSAVLARRARTRLVIDLLPNEHRDALDLAGSITGLRVEFVDPDGRPGGHDAKAAKGALARALLLDGPGVLDKWRHARFELRISEL